MSDEIVYALLNNKIKKLTKKVEGAAIPAKLSDLKNDLYGQIELLVGEAAKNDIVIKEYEVEGSPQTIVFANLSSDTGVKEAIMAGAILTGYIKQINSSLPLTFDKPDVDDDSFYKILLPNSEAVAHLFIGCKIDHTNMNVIESDINSIVVFKNSRVIEAIESFKITATHTKKIPAEHVESDIFIAKYGETPFVDIKAAWDSDKACYLEMKEDYGHVRLPFVNCSSSTAQAQIDAQGLTLVVLVNLSNEWLTHKISLLPSITSSDAGKFLRVDSGGQWVAEAVPSAEGGSF